MNKPPKVSIIIPVYNGADYLRNAIDSALAQTYPNFEVLVVNDGSNDGGKTRAIALSYGDKIRYFEKENGGVATALNFGIGKMRGEYFSWLSHDDQYFPYKLERQINFITQEPYQRVDVILYSDVEIIDEYGSHIDNVKCGNQKTLPVEAVAFGLINGCTVLIPKACFSKVGNFNPDLPTTQDYDMWYRLAKQYPFVHLPVVLIKSRQHAGQQSKLDDQHAIECNTFYIDFIKDLAAQNEYSATFFIKLAAFLKKMRYTQAYQYLKNHIKSNWITELKILFYTYIDTTWGNRVGLLNVITEPRRVWKKLVRKG